MRLEEETQEVETEWEVAGSFPGSVCLHFCGSGSFAMRPSTQQ